MADFARTRGPRQLLAGEAGIATGEHTCAVCGQAIHWGTREARLPGSDNWCHIWPCLVRGRPA